MCVCVSVCAEVVGGGLKDSHQPSATAPSGPLGFLCTGDGLPVPLSLGADMNRGHV